MTSSTKANKPYTLYPQMHTDRIALADEHTTPVAALLQAGKHKEAYKAFHNLCSQIYDLKSYEASQLADKIRQLAELEPPPPQQCRCPVCDRSVLVTAEHCPGCFTPREKHLVKKPTYQNGERVTCLHTVNPYYSGYAGNPVREFKPGMVGTVAHVAPKVCIKGEPPVYDRHDEFIVVDYVDPADGKKQRVGLNFCNIEKVT